MKRLNISCLCCFLLAIICMFPFSIVLALNEKMPESRSLQGRITDTDGQPLEGATVYISELNRSGISGKDGYYMVRNLPNLDLHVQYSYVGYAHQLKKVYISDAGTFLNVQLEASPIEAEDIVVTGVQHSTQHENAVKIDVLKFNDSGVGASPNFTEKLTRIPGVDMISKGSGVSKPVVRGLSMNDVLILNQGVRYENYQYSNHHPLGIDEYGIDKVEVIKGPASLLYGSDAIGGVVNFIKENPAPQNQLMGDYQVQLFSNSLGESNSLGLKGATERVLGGVRFSQKSHADYLQGGGAFLPNSRFQETSLKADAGYTTSVGNFRLYYDYNKQNLGLAEEEAMEAIAKRGRRSDLFYEQLNTHVFSSQNNVFLGRTKLDLNAAFQNTELIHFGEVNAYELQMQLSTLTYEAKVQLPSNTTSTYILGFQGIHQENENLNQRETILLPNAQINNYSTFGFLQRSIGIFKIQTGMRYDFKTLDSHAVGSPDDANYRKPLNKEYGSYSGSIGFTCNPLDELFFRSNLATAYRTPNLAELTSNGPHEAIYELGDDCLSPEKSLEFDLSAHWHKPHIALDLAGFYNRIGDYIFQAPTGNKTSDGLSIYQFQQNNSKLYGGEAGMHVHPSFVPWLHVEGTFSWVIGKQNNGDYLPFIPAHKLHFELRGERERLAFLKNAFAAVHAHFAMDQKRPAPDETETSGYQLYDLNFGGTLNRDQQPFILGFSITNLLDTKYIDHLSTLKEVGGYNPGRNFILTCKVPFRF